MSRQIQISQDAGDMPRGAWNAFQPPYIILCLLWTELHELVLNWYFVVELWTLLNLLLLMRLSIVIFSVIWMYPVLLLQFQNKVNIKWLKCFMHPLVVINHIAVRTYFIGYTGLCIKRKFLKKSLRPMTLCRGTYCAYFVFNVIFATNFYFICANASSIWVVPSFDK